MIENSDDSQKAETENGSSNQPTESTSKTVEPEKATETNSAEDQITDDFGPVPDLCEGHFDSVAYLNNAIYVFKESYIWQFNLNFELDDDFPKKIDKIFPNLPKRFKKIDAVYEIPDEDEIVFFSGSEYITYDIRGPIYSAYNITRYTYDPDIEKIDAAMIWCKFEDHS